MLIVESEYLSQIANLIKLKGVSKNSLSKLYF